MGFTDEWEQHKFSEFTFAMGEKNKKGLPLEPYAITNDRGFIPQIEAHEEFGYMKDVDQTMYIIVKPDMFVYNPARINVGSLGYYSGTENVIVSSLYEVFKTNEDVNDNFLKHWFKTIKFQNWIKKLQEGSVRLYFYFDKLCECRMAIPLLPEQTKIGLFLDKLDNLITLYQRKLNQLTAFKKAMLGKMFPQEGARVPEVRFSGFTDDWEQRKLEDVVNIYDGVHQTPNYQKSGIMFLSVEDIATLKSKKYISEEAFQKDYKIYPKRGDILMTRIGDVGTTNVVNSSEKIAFYVSLALLRPLEIDSYFLTNAMQTSTFQKGLRNRTLTTAVPQKINKNEIGKVSLNLPPNLDEQQKIGEFFQSLDNLITLHQNKLTALQQAKQSLLQKMFI